MAVWGGGMTNSEGSHSIVTNCIFIENTADNGGGMDNRNNSNPILTNCTFSGNSAENSGGGIYNTVSIPTLTNCILWGNTAGSGVGASAQIWGDSIINYSCLQGYVEPNEPYEPPTQGLISHWAFDEGSGSTAYDSFGDNDGNLMGAPNWTTGQVDGALSFDGVDDYVEVPDAPSLDGMDALTITAWIKTDSSGDYMGVVSKYIHSSGDNLDDSYCLLLDPSGAVIFQYNPGNIYVIKLSSPTVADGSWHHIVGVYTGTEGSIYIDGNEVPLFRDYSDPGGSLNNTDVQLTIGSSNNNGTLDFFFQGTIDDVRIYDRALSAEEIRQLYRYQSGVVVNQGNIGAAPVFVDPDNGDYRLIPGSPCIDAGDNTAVPADMADLDGDDDCIERTPCDLDGSMRFVDISPPGGAGVVDPCGYYDIVDMGVFEANYMETRMKFTPPVLNLKSRGRWVIAHLVMPEGFIVVEDVDIDTPFRVDPIGITSEFVNVFINEDGDVEIEAGFARRDFCGAEIGDGLLDITVSGLLANGEYFYGACTVNIRSRTLEYLSSLASYWLQSGCRPPHWCEGADFNKDSMVDFVDLAIFDGCCIETVKK
jgi:predicted outer membrane repeat protein